MTSKAVTTTPGTEADTLPVTIIFATTEQQPSVKLWVQPGCTARQAVLRASEYADPQVLAALRSATLLPDATQIAFSSELIRQSMNPASAPLAIFGQVVEDDRVLSAGDRVELLRPLRQDPKEWRRQRAKMGKTS